MPKRFDAASNRFAARSDPTPRRIDPSRSNRLDAARSDAAGSNRPEPAPKQFDP